MPPDSLYHEGDDPSRAEHNYPAYSCDMDVDGVPICEGDVPESVGEYRSESICSDSQSHSACDAYRDSGGETYEEWCIGNRYEPGADCPAG